jgi:hypothetical protein
MVANGNTILGTITAIGRTLLLLKLSQFQHVKQRKRLGRATKVSPVKELVNEKVFVSGRRNLVQTIIRRMASGK